MESKVRNVSRRKYLHLKPTSPHIFRKNCSKFGSEGYRQCRIRNVHVCQLCVGRLTSKRPLWSFAEFHLRIKDTIKIFRSQMSSR